MDWQGILVILNTIDTFMGVVFLVGSWLGIRAWWRSRRRHAQEGSDAVGSAGPEDTQEDEVIR